MDKDTVKRFFDRYARQWDARQVRHEDRIRRILDVAEIREGVSVLDVACGTGLFSRGLLAKASEVYGVDLSWGMLQQAREYSSEMKLVRAGADKLPFQDDSFDLVICFVAFHLFDNVGKVLKEMHRVLVEGGVLVGLTYLLTAEWEKEEHIQTYLDPQGIHFFTVDELDELLGGGHRRRLYHLPILRPFHPRSGDGL